MDNPQSSKREVLKCESDRIMPLLKTLQGGFHSCQNKIKHCYYGTQNPTWPGLGLPSSFLSDLIPATQTFFLFLKAPFCFITFPFAVPLPITLVVKIFRWLAPSVLSDLSSKVSSQSSFLTPQRYPSTRVILSPVTVVYFHQSPYYYLK